MDNFIPKQPVKSKNDVEWDTYEMLEKLKFTKQPFLG
jgi:hypothetical protein